jgi:hypothetical protein
MRHWPRTTACALVLPVNVVVAPEPLQTTGRVKSRLKGKRLMVCVEDRLGLVLPQRVDVAGDVVRSSGRRSTSGASPIGELGERGASSSRPIYRG